MSADLTNGLALGLALALAAAGALLQDEPGGGNPTVQVRATTAEVGVDKVTDARGQVVPSASYQRVVSLNPVADHLLFHLLEPARLVGVTRYTLEQHPDAWRFGSTSPVAGSDQVEAILALEPDLVVVSNLAPETQMARLRETGVPVVDLGDMLGVETTLRDIRTLGALLQRPQEAARLAARFQRQLDALDAAVSDDRAPWGLYLGIYGDVCFGGTLGTSYADMLRYGGVRDLAAEHGYRRSPQYDPEQLLTMNPTLVITQEGMGRLLCQHPVLGSVAACQPGGRVIELAGHYHTDAGLGLVEAAAQLVGLVHPQHHEDGSPGSAN